MIEKPLMVVRASGKSYMGKLDGELPPDGKIAWNVQIRLLDVVEIDTLFIPSMGRLSKTVSLTGLDYASTAISTVDFVDYDAIYLVDSMPEKDKKKLIEDYEALTRQGLVEIPRKNIVT